MDYILINCDALISQCTIIPIRTEYVITIALPQLKMSQKGTE